MEAGFAFIDEIIFRQACRPGADVVSAALRTSLFMGLIQTLPQEFADFLQNGQPTDGLFELFASFPVTGDRLDLSSLLNELKTKKPCAI